MLLTTSPSHSNGTIGIRRFLWMACLLVSVFFNAPAVGQVQDSSSVLLSTFDVDVTPPVGSHMAYDPVKRVDELTLRSRGIILKGHDAPIVLCAVDFGIANEAHDAWRDRHCPQCAGAKRADWLDSTSQLLLHGITYFQVVFTIPD